MALGIISGRGFILLGLSCYLHQRIAVKRRNVMHRLTALRPDQRASRPRLLGDDEQDSHAHIKPDRRPDLSVSPVTIPRRASPVWPSS